MGCWCQPSPALRTFASTHSVSRRGAPLEEWRMTMASTPMAWRVSAVSFSDSPLLTLEPLAEKLMTSADSRFSATSKEIRVRVESS